MLTVRQRYGQTDRRTDGRTDGRLTIAIPRFALRASRGKKKKEHREYFVAIVYCMKTRPFTDCLILEATLHYQNVKWLFLMSHVHELGFFIT